MTNSNNPHPAFVHFKQAQDIACELVRLGIQTEHAGLLTPEKVAVWLQGLDDAGKVEVVMILAAQHGLAWRVIEESDRTGCTPASTLEFLTEEGDPERYYLDFARDLGTKPLFG